MPEIVPKSPLDRLRWLVKGKLMANEIEKLGRTFNPQFHFTARLPSPALPASETEKSESYFDAMFETLVPVRDLISGYRLKGVMSRSPESDFSLEIQFSDPDVVEMIRKTLPRELSGSPVIYQPENAPTTQAEVLMLFHDKNGQENPDQTNSEPSQLQDAAPPPASPVEESPLRIVAIEPLSSAAVLPEPVYTPPVAVLTPPSAPELKPNRMVVAKRITIKGGDISGCDHLVIEGEAHWTIDRCEKLEVLAGGIFKGSASVAEAVISGYCSGTLVVSGTLRVTRTGHFVGSVQYGCLQVEESGVVEGELKKIAAKGSETAPQTSENPLWFEVKAKLSA